MAAVLNDRATGAGEWPAHVRCGTIAVLGPPVSLLLTRLDYYNNEGGNYRPLVRNTKPMLTKDPRHEECRNALVQLVPAEIRRRIAVQDRTDPDYVSSEVLSSLVRVRYGGAAVLDVAARALYARVMSGVERYLRQNPKWDALAASSSETVAEATSSAWAALITDKAPVSLAEVRFWPFIEARALDYLRAQLAHKNTMVVPLETMGATDEEGNEVAFENTLAADEDEQPEAMLQRKLLAEALHKAYVEMPAIERRAVFMRLECQYGWDEVARLLKCSVPTARKHYNNGVARLMGAMQ